MVRFLVAFIFLVPLSVSAVEKPWQQKEEPPASQQEDSSRNPFGIRLSFGFAGKSLPSDIKDQWALETGRSFVSGIAATHYSKRVFPSSNSNLFSVVSLQGYWTQRHWIQSSSGYHSTIRALETNLRLLIGLGIGPLSPSFPASVYFGLGPSWWLRREANLDTTQYSKKLNLWEEENVTTAFELVARMPLSENWNVQLIYDADPALMAGVEYGF